MGLTVVYRYKIKTGHEAARDLVARLHAFAATLPFDELSGVTEYDPPDARYVFKRPSHVQRDWKPGSSYLTRKRDDGLEESVRVPALHVMSFVVRVRGAESAEFGLASHPPVVVHREDVVTRRDGRNEERQIGAGPSVEVPTRLRGWYSWSQGCKTQYAALPSRGGPENFVRAHLSIFHMVDECKRLGMTTRVRDDGKYWRHRDVGKLLKELSYWDELVAGIVGRLSDQLTAASPDGSVVAPIKDRPDFEHLEAKGADRIQKAAKRAATRRRTIGGDNT